MDKEVNRIIINRLYSENDIFDEIIFHDGINLILGEKYNDLTISGRKTNGVGKSMSIEFLNFCLLSDYKESRVYKIPEKIMPLNENITVDLTIGRDQVSIKRNRKNESKPTIIRNGISVSFNKLNDAKLYISEIVFSKMDGNAIPSFRNILSLLIRDERTEFIDILKCHDLNKNVPNDLTSHLYILGINIEAYQNALIIIKEIDTISKIISKLKKDLTDCGNRKISDIRAELNSLDDELKKMESAIESFKSNEAYESIENDLAEIESNLEILRTKHKVLKYEFDRIKILPRPEAIENSEIELVYNQFKSELGSAIVKSLNEVLEFKNKVEDFQRILINKKAHELEEQMRLLSERIRVLDDDYAEKLKLIDTKGILKNLKTSLKIYNKKKEDFSRIGYQFDEYEKSQKQKSYLKLEKSKKIIEIDELIENWKQKASDFETTILNIHEDIMGNKECFFNIETINKASNKIPIKIDLRIYDDGSRSINRTKVFIYDMALLFNINTRSRHPLFLVHDNIFDVDQDTLVQCLNYLGKQEQHIHNFQYILTLNRDKIESEERLNLIKFDIDSKTIARFTKENKFLKMDYQEK